MLTRVLYTGVHRVARQPGRSGRQKLIIGWWQTVFNLCLHCLGRGKRCKRRRIAVRSRTRSTVGRGRRNMRVLGFTIWCVAIDLGVAGCVLCGQIELRPWSSVGVDDTLGKQIINCLAVFRRIRCKYVIEGAILTNDQNNMLDRRSGLPARIVRGRLCEAGSDRRYDDGRHSNRDDRCAQRASVVCPILWLQLCSSDFTRSPHAEAG